MVCRTREGPKDVGAVSGPAGFGPVEQERAEARHRLEAIRTGLHDGSATSADHRPALDALLVLPRAEAERWLEEIRTGFVAVYAREREERRQKAG